MAWSVRGGRRAERRAARHRWDELFPTPGPTLLDAADPSAPLDAGAPSAPLDAGGPSAPLDAGGPSAPLDAGAPSGVDALPDAGAQPRTDPLPDPGARALSSNRPLPYGRPPSDDAQRTSHGRRRLVVSLRAAMALVLVLALCGGLWWWSSASTAPDVRSVEAADDADTGHGPAEEPEGPSDENPRPGQGEDGSVDGDAVVAHVAGAVGTPGVYRLPRGARYHEAIGAAGGPAPDADVHRLNLAAAVEDGTRLYVPRIGEAVDPAAGAGQPAAGGAPAAGGSPAGSSGAAGAKVNLNTATVEELGALPRVGPVLAQRIVDFRTQHGRFGAPEDLDAVDGIGPKMLEALLPLVTV